MRPSIYEAAYGAARYARAYPPRGGWYAELPAEWGIDVNQLRTASSAPPPIAAASSGGGDRPVPVVQFPQTQRVTESQRFGDPVVQPIVANIASGIALARSPTRRTFLQIQNKSAVATLYYSFGSAATSASLEIEPLGASSAYSQFVPQNELHIAASADATTAVLVYANKGENE